VFRDYANALLRWRTVASNVAFGIERKLPRGECADRVKDALSLVGLSGRAHDSPWQLSGGMQQRVQIARALALRPAVMLMDEPFAALDAMTKAGLQDELLRVRDRTGTSFVFITHDIEEAVYLGDRVAVLNGSLGRIKHIVTIDLSQSSGSDIDTTAASVPQLSIQPSQGDRSWLVAGFFRRSIGLVLVCSRCFWRHGRLRFAQAPSASSSFPHHKPFSPAPSNSRGMASCCKICCVLLCPSRLAGPLR
jgi:energy-coupling factor transporter ATP-binding protein EcfA2